MVDHLRVRSLPADLAGRPDVVPEVGRAAHVLGFPVLHPDGDVLPVVRMTGVEWVVG